MLKEFKKAFTLAEVLIVIGIIGVVATLTLPNLNHATGDKETVTRLKKAYSILNEANDRAVAIYGPISTWSKECRENLQDCWMKRTGEFLKISKYCDEKGQADSETYIACNSLYAGDMSYGDIIYQLTDGITFSNMDGVFDCDWKSGPYNDLCSDGLTLDINGPNKGKNKYAFDIFQFMISDSMGIIPYVYDSTEVTLNSCIVSKEFECTLWVLEYENLDYLKADESGKCNDSNIILDGITNTSCH